MKKVIIIVSGGMDSITLLHEIADRYLPENILAISFNYGSKHNTMEIPMAIHNCAKLKIDHKIIDMVQVFSNFNSALLDKKDSEKIPKGHYEDSNMKKTVVSFRNGIFLSVATGVAETVGARQIYYGAHAGDFSIYPDCRPKFIEHMSKAALFGTYNQVKIAAPYWKFTKAEILKRGVKLDVDYSMTHTCYNPQNGIACGSCGSCIERCAAFIVNEIKDPIKYQRSWKNQIEYTRKILNTKKK